MKKQTFTVTVEFEDKIHSDEEIMEVAENIAKGIAERADNGMGIAPEKSDTYLVSIAVTPQFLPDTINITIV